MAGQKDYFAKSAITPEFLRRKHSSDNLKNLEKSALKQPAASATPLPLYVGIGKKAAPKTTQKSSFKLKKFSPILIIFAILGIGGATIIGSPAILGPHIEAVFTEATDTQYTSYRIRSRHLVTEALDGKIKLSNYMKTRLEKSGIKVTGNGNKTILHYQGHDIDSSNFKEFYNNDPEFREAYTKAKRGRVANFFDDSAVAIYRKLGLSRNVFSDFKNTGDDVADKTSYDKTMTDYFDGDSNTRINTVEDRTTTNDDGEEVTERTKNGEDASAKNTDGDTPNAKARSYLSSISSKVASANMGCTVLKVGSMISAAVAANEIYQSINYFMLDTENISKMKAGSGNASAVNQFLNFMTTTSTTTVADADTGEEITVTGSPLESEGNRLILSGGETRVNLEKTKHYSLERAAKSTLATIAMSGLTTTACNTARAAGAVISLAAFAVPGGGLIRATIGMLLDTTIGVGVQVAVGGIIGFMVPTIARAMFTNAFEGVTGIPAGEMYAKGASAANTRVGRSSSGQSPSSTESILAYNQTTKEVLAHDAEIDRRSKHPLDVSSKNTFLGSIASKLYTLPSSTYFGAINHLTNLTATTLAAGEDTSYMTTFGDCPTLESIGARGDIYCNPITTTDLSTINLSSDDPVYRSIIDPNLTIDEAGNEAIIDNSELANYIVYCTERDSPFGVMDANIANAFETSLGVVGDNLPILNDVIDIINATESQAAEPWATGSICINSPQNERWDSEMKYYQRYVEDTRIMDQLGVYEGGKSPIVSFKEHYYKLNPLDNSRAGYLARISGITKEDAETILAIYDYYQIVDKYNPELAHNFTPKLKQAKLSFKDTMDHTIIANPIIVALSYNYYSREEIS